ncbi:uncharacterized protein LOC115883787 [Sitophilus oryzae]|uniref:Uncharacterized protein LOC115883787 n=1 Tax=Sitophilus oryzae TaxID=7048 RepID=A0A6J2Y437_SITOR|nr:uncharacterized protein LOC115883787 [Sitophilus oryzae]
MDSTDEINDEFLLQCVANYKPLYDKGDKGYKSVIQKENCWASVARSLNTSGKKRYCFIISKFMYCVNVLVSAVKARFKALREKYRRELIIEEKLKRSGAPASTRPIWPLLSFLKFMYKCGTEQQRATTSNFEVDTVDSETSNEPNTDYYCGTDDDSELIEIDHINTEMPTANVATPTTSEVATSSVASIQTSSGGKKRKLAYGATKEIDSVLTDVSEAIKNTKASCTKSR